MIKSYTLILLLCMVGVAKSQNFTNDCSRRVLMKDDATKVPSSVCIPKGYLISNIYRPFDANEDGFNDFIFKWHKCPLQDGDSVYITIYTQKPKGVYTHFRTFSNLYPVYNKEFDWDYASKDSCVQLLHNSSADKPKSKHPLWDFDFVNNTIAVTMHIRASSNLVTYYKFDKRINNWVYLRCEIVDVSEAK